MGLETRLNQESPSIDRRRFLKGLILASGLAILSPLGELVAHAKGSKEVSERKNPSKLTVDDYVRNPKLIQKYTVPELARTSKVPFYEVRYDAETGRSNYQEILDGIKSKGTILLLYTTEDGDPLSKRDAVIARHSAEESKLPLIIYDDLLKSSNKEFWTIVEEKEYNIYSVPSIFLFSTYDLLKEPQTKSGKLKCIDILRGGPGKKKYFREWFDGALMWVSQNVTKPNGEWLWRFKNSGNEKKYTYDSSHVLSNRR